MRFDGIEKGEQDLFTRIFFRFLRRRQGRVPAPLRIYAYRPSIMWSFLRLARVVRRKGELPPRLKGLAMYWTARLIECRF